jgi:hypothetical protein
MAIGSNPLSSTTQSGQTEAVSRMTKSKVSQKNPDEAGYIDGWTSYWTIPIRA